MKEIKATNDRKPAADRAGHADFMDHPKKTLDSPEGPRAPKVRRSAAEKLSCNLLSGMVTENCKSNEVRDVFL